MDKRNEIWEPAQEQLLHLQSIIQKLYEPPLASSSERMAKMTGETPEVRSDKRKPREKKERKRERKKREKREKERKREREKREKE